MKILHFNEHLSWAGGVETYLLNLLPLLEQAGHPQAIVYAQGDARLASHAIHLPELAHAGRRAERAGYRRTRDVLADERPDVVHVHSTHNTGVLRACLESVPTILHGHDYRFLCPASSMFYRRTQEICGRKCGPGCFTTTLTKHCLTPRPLPAVRSYRRVRFVARNAARFAQAIGPSESVRARFLQAGFAADRVTTLPYFCPLVPLDRPRPAPPRPTVLFIGRLRDIKGYRYFVQALGLLPADVRGTMIGDFTAERTAEVERLATAAGCRDRLQLRPWAKREEIRGVMSQASLLVFPSIWPETLGIVGLEALACGVPVVACDVGGVREWLLPERTGLLVPPKDAAALAAAVRRILASGELLDAMGRAGLELIRERFSTDAHVDGLERIYEQAAGCAAAGIVGVAR